MGPVTAFGYCSLCGKAVHEGEVLNRQVRDAEGGLGPL